MSDENDSKQSDTLAIADSPSVQAGTPPEPDFSYFLTDPNFRGGHLMPQSGPFDEFVSFMYKQSHVFAARPLARGLLFVGLDNYWFQQRPVEERDVTSVTALVLVVDNFTHSNQLQSFPFTLAEITAQLPYRGYAYSDFADVAGHERFIVIFPLASPVTPREHLRLRVWARSLLGREGVTCLPPHIPIHFPCSSINAKMSGTEWKSCLDGPMLSMDDVPANFVGPAYVAPVVPKIPPSATTEGGESNPERYLYDLAHNKFIVRSSLEDGEEATIGVYAMRMIMGADVLPKLIDGQVRQIPRFHCRAPLYDSSELLVQTGDVVTLNSYVPSKIKPAKGDWSAIWALLRHLAGDEKTEDGANFIADWLAMPLQHLHRHGVPLKMLTAVVLRGNQGTGKGLLKQILRHIYGGTNVGVINQKVIDGDFNTLIQDKLLLVAEEVKSDTAKYAETREKLKMWITEPEVLIEGKGTNIVERPSHFNMIFFSNKERPVDVEQRDRRFSVFSQEEKLADEVINEVVADLDGDCRQVSAFMYELLHRAVTITKRTLFESEARNNVRDLGLTPEERFAQDVALYGIDDYANAWAKVTPLWENQPRAVWVRNDSDDDTKEYVTASAISGAFEAWAASEGEQLPLKRSSRALATALRKAVVGAQPVKDPIKVGRALVRVWQGFERPEPEAAKKQENQNQENADDGDFGA